MRPVCSSFAAPALVIALSLSFGARAGDHYFSLKTIFPDGKCSAVILNFELMTAGFAGGETTEYKIHDDHGGVVEVITAFVSKGRDQWAIVGSRRDEKVIFCLYASGVGRDSVGRRPIKPE